MNNSSKSNLTACILTRTFPNIVQTYVLNHITSLKNSGIDTVIISEDIPQHQEMHPKVDKFNLLNDTIYVKSDLLGSIKYLFLIPFSFKHFRNLQKVIFSNIWKKYGIKYGIKTLVRVSFLSIKDIDVIHSHSLFSSYDYLFLKDIFGIPLTTTFHGLVPNNVKMLEERKIASVLDSGDAFFVNTNFAREQLENYGCPPEKIHIIPQGTDLSDFDDRKVSINKDKPIIILSVGRLSIEKGFHIAIQAIAKLVDEFPNIEYRVVGNGLERTNLQNLIEKLELNNNVILHGSLTTKELAAQYSQAHIFILPSIDLHDGFHVETQGVVLQEAQASGIPVIASKTGGIPEVIRDNETGLLFEEANENQLAEKIQLLINNQDFCQSISMNGRKDVESRFDINGINRQLINVYNRFL